MVQNELTHYGILGMKWGVRRYQNKDGALTAAGKRRAKLREEYENAHDDYKKVHDSKNVRNMSDAELRGRLNRLQMEKQYSQMRDSDINRGKQYVNAALKVGATVATATTTAITIYNNADKIRNILEHSPAGKLMNIGLSEMPIRA